MAKDEHAPKFTTHIWTDKQTTHPFSSCCSTFVRLLLWVRVLVLRLTLAVHVCSGHTCCYWRRRRHLYNHGLGLLRVFVHQQHVDGATLALQVELVVHFAGCLLRQVHNSVLGRWVVSCRSTLITHRFLHKCSNSWPQITQAEFQHDAPTPQYWQGSYSAYVPTECVRSYWVCMFLLSVYISSECVLQTQRDKYTKTGTHIQCIRMGTQWHCETNVPLYTILSVHLVFLIWNFGKATVNLICSFQFPTTKGFLTCATCLYGS